MSREWYTHFSAIKATKTLDSLQKKKKKRKCWLKLLQVSDANSRKKCTLPRSYFKARKTSRFLKDLNSALSSSRKNAFSKHSATKLELPFWGFLKLASSSTGLPKLRVNRGLQLAGFLDWSPPSLVVLTEEVFFCCPLLV